MKKILLLSILAGASALTAAQERAQVLSATPIVEQVPVSRQVCGNEMVYTGPRTSGGGAVLGAIAGGAAGNAVGGGSGRGVATALGLIGGAVLGNHIEGNGRPDYQNVQRCGTQTVYENRTTGYDVVYEYAGRRYTTRTQYDPGQTINVSVQPVEQSFDPRYINEGDGYRYNNRYDNGRLEQGGYAPYSQYDNAPAQTTSPGATVIEYESGQPRGYYPYAPPRQQWR